MNRRGILTKFGLLGFVAALPGLGAASTPKRDPEARRLADEAAIRDTIMLYNFFLDDHRTEEWANLFTEDGEFRVGRLHVKGRDVIRRDLGEHPRTGKHLIHPGIVRFISDTEARAWSDLLRIDISPEEPDNPNKLVITSAARYYDRLVKVDGNWLFAERVEKVTAILNVDNPEYFLGKDNPGYYTEPPSR